MTVLDLDPPQPLLRLVSTNAQAATRDPRYRASASLRGDARALYREVLQAALEWGEPIEADALRVILAVRQSTSASPTRLVTSSAIWQLMFVDVVAWCRNRHLDVPDGCAQALGATIDYLNASDTFESGSDSAAELHEAIDECTGGWSETHPTSSRAPRRSLRSQRGPKRS